MLPDAIFSTSSKPRVLIADDSRIVRATLIKHIQGMFEFREALDGEEAWETLLIDPSIRVVITDLTMPKLDGYGLLKRIRSSEITRIRTIPVVVVSGSDEAAERNRAKSAGATDLITKGIGTAQFLSRLEILSKLAHTQKDFERSLEVLVLNAPDSPPMALTASSVLEEQAEEMLATAVQNSKNFCVLNISVGLKHTGLNGISASPPISVVNAIGQLLQRTIRQKDRVAKTGNAEFTVVTGSVSLDSARTFAQRLCKAIARAHKVNDAQMAFIVSCGLVTLSEKSFDTSFAMPSFMVLQDMAKQRATFGLHHSINGVIGEAEELEFEKSNVLPVSSNNETSSTVAPTQELNQVSSTSAMSNSDLPDIATLLVWIKEGKQDQVMQHLSALSCELQPLVDLMLIQCKK